MKGLAWYEADTCSGCGKSLSMTTHPDAEAKDWLARRYTCSACEMISIKQSSVDSDDPENKHTRAHIWTVEPLGR